MPPLGRAGGEDRVDDPVLPLPRQRLAAHGLGILSREHFSLDDLECTRLHDLGSADLEAMRGFGFRVFAIATSPVCGVRPQGPARRDPDFPPVTAIGRRVVLDAKRLERQRALDRFAVEVAPLRRAHAQARAVVRSAWREGENAAVGRHRHGLARAWFGRRRERREGRRRRRLHRLLDRLRARGPREGEHQKEGERSSEGASHADLLWTRKMLEHFL